MKRLSFRLFEIVPLAGLVAEGVPELTGSWPNLVRVIASVTFRTIALFG
ncbi:MAG: hypothetical protein K2G93_01745 [Rikenella sp.]|nr:hypothetical protein [Rikenella sp.]